MEAVFQKIINFDQNLLAIILLVIFYSFEELFNTAFQFKNRGRHLFYNALLQTGYVIVNFGFAIVLVSCFQWLGHHNVGLFYLITITAL